MVAWVGRPIGEFVPPHPGDSRPGIFGCGTAAYCLGLVGWAVIDISVPLKGVVCQDQISVVGVVVMAMVATLLLCSRRTGEGFFLGRTCRVRACTRARC